MAFLLLLLNLITSHTGAKQSIAISVCMSVCLYDCISQKLNVQTSRNFLYMFTLAVARSSSGDSGAAQYVRYCRFCG